MQHLQRRRKWIPWGVVALGLPLLQLLIAVLSPPHAGLFAYLFTLAAVIAATATAFSRLGDSSYDKGAVFGLSIALLVWSLALLTTPVDVALLDRISINTHYTYMLFVLYGIPLLYICVSYGEVYSSRSQRLVDLLLLLLMGFLYCLSIQDVLGSQGDVGPEGFRWINYALDVENGFLLVSFLVRLLTATRVRERRFFMVTTSYLLVYAICMALHNHWGGTADPLILRRLGQALAMLPFTLLICFLLSSKVTSALASATPWLHRVSLSVGPAMLLAAIFALSLGVASRHGIAGALIVAFALSAYIFRTILTQYWFLQTRDELRDALVAVERLALLDATTEIPNRRALDQVFDAQWREAEREGTPLSVLMVDVDLFKLYNDTYGHGEGDQCLRTVARLLAGSLRRSTDVIARYGGEEFAVILPRTNFAGACAVAARMNLAVYEAALPHDHGGDGRVSVSIGVAEKQSADTNPLALMGVADKALYCAKQAGRNCWSGGRPAN